MFETLTQVAFYTPVFRRDVLWYGVRLSDSFVDSPFLYLSAGHVVTGDFTCIPDKGLRSLIKKGPKYRLPSRIDFTKCRDIVEDSDVL